jgi:hypothetical protein
MDAANTSDTTEPVEAGQAGTAPIADVQTSSRLSLLATRPPSQ